MENILKKEIVLSKSSSRVICAVIFLILTVLGAFVRVPLPFTPVPVTLQTFFVLLSGALLGSGFGAMVQMSYIFLGIAGIPVFTGAGSGFLYLFGPTGGYLAGFILAVLFLGRAIKHSNNLLTVFGLFCFADFILLFCGALWLKVLLGCGITKALFIGVLPFIPGDIVKALVASGLYLKLKPRLKEII